MASPTLPLLHSPNGSHFNGINAPSYMSITHQTHNHTTPPESIGDQHDTEQALLQTPSSSEKRQQQHASARSEYLESAVLGMADGLTVPFALTAGLSSIGSSKLVIAAGLAELVAGAISMGLGEFLSSDVRAKQWDIEHDKQARSIRCKPAREEEALYDFFQERWGISRLAARPVVEELMCDEGTWVDFMLTTKLSLSKPHPSTATICGLVMSCSYTLGGTIPMLPYFFVSSSINKALLISILITVVVLLIFGYAKAAIGGADSRKARWQSSVQTLVVGALAAGSSYGIVYGINSRLLVGGEGVGTLIANEIKAFGF